jgi:hypothetical protein
VNAGGRAANASMAGRGATPMVPKNGPVNGMTTPGAISAVLAWRLIGMIR